MHAVHRCVLDRNEILLDYAHCHLFLPYRIQSHVGCSMLDADCWRTRGELVLFGHE